MRPFRLSMDSTTQPNVTSLCTQGGQELGDQSRVVIVLASVSQLAKKSYLCHDNYMYDCMKKTNYRVRLITLVFCYCKDYQLENYENSSFGSGVFNISGKRDVIWRYIFF